MSIENDNHNQGLYRPEFERDSCGIGLIANIKNQKSHLIVEHALTMLENMEHRGASGYEANTGDGSGILIQVPDEFLRRKCDEIDIQLPKYGHYGVGALFVPQNATLREKCLKRLEAHARELDLNILGYRKLNTNNSEIGVSAKSVEPQMMQVFVVSNNPATTFMALERKLYVLRNYSANQINQRHPESIDQFYFASFSYKTIVYKGQLTSPQLRGYFDDLHHPDLITAIAIVHSRFSTNTFPKWRLAQPLRYVAHNGEINTIRANLNTWKTKELMLQSKHFTEEEFQMLVPVCDSVQSDSANFDNVAELLCLCGRPLPHVMMMMIPEAWQGDENMDETKRAFYEYHRSLMEPWDGPAAMCFTDGNVVGATLDRNGLRPARYVITKKGHLVLASEAGALQVPPSDVLFKGRLQPGKMLVANLGEGRILTDEDLKRRIASRKPYAKWLKENKEGLFDMPKHLNMPSEKPSPNANELFVRQKIFGYTTEDINVILKPMATDAKAPIGSMGADTPLAPLSEQSQHIANYFKQLFAQVTNPPIDPIRERMVMSLNCRLGAQINILDESSEHCRHIDLDHPILKNRELVQLCNVWHEFFRTQVINIYFKADGNLKRLRNAVERICLEAEQAVRYGANILVLSDRVANRMYAPMPALMATGAVHHHLIRKGLRSRVSLVVETGEVRESHHLACLLGYGASAVNPYLAMDSIAGLAADENETEEGAQNHIDGFIKAMNKEMLKTLSKIGISTLHSYIGSQIFEIVGLHQEVVNTCFTGSVSRLGGLNFEDIAVEVLARHKSAYPDTPLPYQRLETGGIYQWKRRGEFHKFNPMSVHLLQHSVRSGDYDIFKKYTVSMNEQAGKACTLRSLFAFKKRKSIPLDEVEPVENILKRFSTGAMSFGSISHEAHSTLALAMNAIGGKSNSGEGGEDPARYEPLPDGRDLRSATKQVASGRFGVTIRYLSNADELQIKMAQGAKPGEGGQLPGHKVDENIARVRHSTPGVGLISPPPHHDIYSIEDLAQLIFDLKNANRKARINVKLVAETGVGVVAAGVAKAHADVILISGHDGGTGASPLSSIRHAGLPWEMGLAEAHQTLVKNRLRSRVTLQTDGQLRTGRDLAIATLLGAEEWGIATAALVAEGCIMMRKCHLNTCPVGIATQNPELRKKFEGKAEHVINFFTFLAMDLREIMAELGFKTINEMVGQSQVLQVRPDLAHWKLSRLDLSPILYQQPAEKGVGLFKSEEQEHNLETVLDSTLIAKCLPKLKAGKLAKYSSAIVSTDRAVGTMLSNEICKYFKQDLEDDAVHLKFRGSAGQSFAAFGAKGITFDLEGEANDYIGKGLSGGKLIVYPDREATFTAHENIIIGNVALYGATSGEAYFNGLAGERFCVRNSGVHAVVEGVGDHACEYMTGGLVAVLGPTGKNFAAGMSGGIAYVYDEHRSFASNCNMESVDLEELDAEDFTVLVQLLQNHSRYTGSALASGILKRWRRIKHFFVKVMPTEYKAVLEARKAMKVPAKV